MVAFDFKENTMTTIPPESSSELRRSAEKMSRLDDLQNLKEQFPEGSQDILHELLVYQIELEMQNEELRFTQQELEAAKASYFDLYNLAPVGYLTVNDAGLIVNANLAAASMLGVDRGILLRNALSKFIHPGDEDNYFLQRRKLLIGAGGVQKWDTRLMRSDSSIFWANVQCAATDDGEFRITFTDISERKQAEEELLIAKATAESAFTQISEQRDQLETVLSRIKKLEGIIPICSYCKKIRDDHEVWQRLETYICEHSEAVFSHGICPECYEVQRKEWEKMLAPK